MTAPLPTDDTTWLASRLLRRQVVDVSAAAPAGRVVDLIFDSDTCQVMALVIEANSQPQTQGRFSRFFKRVTQTAAVGLDHIISMDGDVVTINANPFSLTQARELDHLPHLNKTVEMAILTMRGVCLGSLSDLLLDDRGRLIGGYVVSPTPVGEEVLPTLDGQENFLEQQSGESDKRMRVIAPDTHLRIGGSLIMLLDEVLPLRETIVLPTEQSLQTVQSTHSISSAPALNGFKH